ncbi:IPT/TIG domain-containing protein (plasmid) [Streptomyces sp. Qhu-G9]|uniref:IPT/TIG domain-containing protein n=1 Tax=Streptomyces sp. Qhu-G9 TaxID=3452799 RepID=UPI0022ABE19C|nr:IPT/TIG domain-containing protein [Streptomyces aurantiacus]WAU78313.1 IPT/TIG domain-containing protein [Streptomyces aurantiacus]
MSIQLSANIENGRSGARLAVRAGDAVTLHAKDTAAPDAPPAGHWTHLPNGSAASSTLDGSTGAELSVVMARSFAQSGAYRFVPDDQRVVDQPAEIVLTARPRWWFTTPHAARLLTLLVGYVAAACGLLVNWGGGDWWNSQTLYTVRSYGFAVLTLVVFLCLTHLLGKGSAEGKSGLVTLFVGADLRASTSKFQYVAWTFLIGFVLAYIAARSSTAGTPFACKTESPGASTKNCVPPEHWDTYLLLLGVPAAAAVVTKGITAYKVANGIVQKTEATENAGVNPADLARDDHGNADLADIQYLLFNMIAVAYVAAVFVGRGTLPTIPPLLVGLTSTAAGAFVLNKSLQTNRPTIRAVAPSRITPGAPIDVSGQNLFPDSTNNTVQIKVGGAQTAGTKRDATTVRFTAPPGMDPNISTLSIVTATGTESDSYTVAVVGLQIIGWAGAAPQPGKVGHLQVTGLPPQQEITAPVTVVVGGRARMATVTNGDASEIVFTVPGDVEGPTQATLRWNGLASDAATLELAPILQAP